MTSLESQIKTRLDNVNNQIEVAARRVGRDPSEITLIAVTKTHGLDMIQAAVAAGLRQFGENRVEEARIKIDQSAGLLPEDVTWHMIGHIQSRKADDVASYFEWVHSVDRLKVARRLSAVFTATGRFGHILLEVNLSGETTKSGYQLSGWPDDTAQERTFIEDVGSIARLPGLQIEGLMTIAPLVSDSELARPVFRRMWQLRDHLADRFPACTWRHLSMGMSGDFQVAIEEQATMLRLGTALFGPRAQNL